MRFEIEPQDLFDCARHARARGLDIVAYYHSHPNGSGEFSNEDRSRAAPGSRHVVVPVLRGRILAPRAWRVAIAKSSEVSDETAKASD